MSSETHPGKSSGLGRSPKTFVRVITTNANTAIYTADSEPVGDQAT
ncbi:MAG: hypothetical protein AAGD25_12655 [Cyanobacteria bacterium P01_F01_bin.150]